MKKNEDKNKFNSESETTEHIVNRFIIRCFYCFCFTSPLFLIFNKNRLPAGGDCYYWCWVETKAKREKIN